MSKKIKVVYEPSEYPLGTQDGTHYHIKPSKYR